MKSRKNSQLTSKTDPGFKAIFDSAPIGIAIGGFEGQIIDANQQFCKILGYPKPEVIGKSISEFTFAEDIPENAELASQLREGAIESYRLEKRYIQKSGETVWVEANVARFNDDSGDFGYSIAYITEISKRKEAEQQVREGAARFSAIFDKAPIAMMLLDDENLIVAANEVASDITGYSNHELTKLTTVDISDPEYHSLAEIYNKEIQQGKRRSYEIESKLFRKNGEPFWVQISIASLDNHKLPGDFRIAHIYDIDQAKSAEISRKRNETLLLQAQRLGKLGYWEWDEINERMISCSEEYANILGVSIDEAVANAQSIEADMSDVHPEDIKRLSQAEYLFLNNTGQLDTEYRIFNADGEIRYVHQISQLETDDDGRPIRSIGTLQDITDRKQAKSELEKRKIMLERSEELGGVGHWEWDEIEDRLSYCSEHYAAIFDMTVEECMAISSSHEGDLMDLHPEDRERVNQADIESFNNAARMDIEYRVINKKGETRYIHQLSDVEKNANGEVIRMFGTVQDITEKKETELELQKRQRMFDRAEELGGAGHWEWDEEEDFLTYCSPQYINIFGESLVEKFRNGDDYQYIHPDDKEEVERQEWNSYENALPHDIEYRLIREDGEIRYIRQLGDVQTNDKGEVIRSFGTVQDITEIKLAMLDLEKANALYQRAEQLGQLGHYYWDEVDNRLIACSTQFASIFGLSPEELIRIGRNVDDYYALIHPDDRERLYAAENEYYHGDLDSIEIQYRIVRKDGDIRHVIQSAEVVLDDKGEVVQSFGTLQDITDSVTAARMLHESKIQFEQTFSKAPIGMALVEKKGTIIELNQSAASMLGYSVEDAVGIHFEKLTHPSEQEQSMTRLHKLTSGEIDNYNVVRRFRHKEGHYIWVDLHCNLIRDASSEPLYIIVQGIDITEQKLLSEKLNYNASHDSLTDLINRRELEVRLNRLIESAIDHGSIHSFCYMDLDKFKVINDTYGHAAGDELLRQLCGLIQGGIRSRDTLARLGGDEFGLLMEHCEAKDALLTAENLRKSINEFRFVWDEHVLNVGVSMGIVNINHKSGDSDNVLKAADNACYLAKDEGRNRIKIYAETDQDIAVRNSQLQWAKKINHALGTNSLMLVAQPIEDLHSNDANNNMYELLLRMQDDNGNLISAMAMLSAAERFGLITKIDKWVIEEACRSILSDPDLLARIKLCSINLSARSITDMDFLDFIEKTVERYHVPPGKICFEITETSAISNFSQASNFMEKLRSHGFYFALDDFGTGLSSFAYLKKLPVDYIKIDGAFIQDILEDPTHLALVKSINELGHVYGKRTIAECVESPEILECVRSIGLDFAQGHGIGMPGPLTTKPRLKIVN